MVDSTLKLWHVSRHHQTPHVTTDGVIGVMNSDCICRHADIASDRTHAVHLDLDLDK